MRKPTEKELLSWVKAAEKLIIRIISLVGWIKILIDAIKAIFD